MTWHIPISWTSGAVVTKTNLDEQVRDNLLETAPAKVTTKGDIVAATGANALERLAVGSDNAILVADSGNSSGVNWGTFTDGSKFDGDQLDIDYTPTNYNPSASPAGIAARVSAPRIEVESVAEEVEGVEGGEEAEGEESEGESEE